MFHNKDLCYTYVPPKTNTLKNIKNISFIFFEIIIYRGDTSINLCHLPQLATVPENYLQINPTLNESNENMKWKQQKKKTKL